MTKEIQLTQGKVAIVDDCDFDFLNTHKWCIRGGGSTLYARRRRKKSEGRGPQIKMHSEVARRMGIRSKIVDHIDGDGLNNRRSNLRRATAAQNGRNRRKPRTNTSGYKGVVRCGNKWRAELRVSGKVNWLGTFATPLAAAIVHDMAVGLAHGDFAQRNFTKEQYRAMDPELIAEATAAIGQYLTKRDRRAG